MSVLRQAESGATGRTSSCHCSCTGCTRAHARVGDGRSMPAGVVQIEAEISRLESEILSLRLRRNAHLPVGRLPPEVLTEIFSYCVPRRRPTQSAHASRRNCISFSQVCHVWRITAVARPPLWDCLMFDFPQLTQEMLVRSGAYPLDVYAIMPFNEMGGHHASDPHIVFADVRIALNATLEHVQRIRTLDIESTTQSFKDHIMPKMTLPAPHLQSLTVRLDNDDPIDCILDIFQGEMPLLRHVDLRACVLPWSTLQVQNITSVTLEQLPESLEHTWNACMDTLMSMPRLTDLSLTYWMPRGVSRHRRSFPRLKTLHFNDIGDFMSNYLECIALSPRLHLHVEGLEIFDPLVDMTNQDAFALIAAFLSASNKYQPLRGIYVEERTRVKSFSISSDADLLPPPQFRLSPPSLPSEQWDGLLVSLGYTAWAHNIEHVAMCSDGRLPMTWAPIFHLLPNCQRVTAVGSAVGSLLDDLASDANQTLHPDALALPRLREVDVEYTGKDSGPNGYSRPVLLVDLQRAFGRRGELGAQLEKLRIAGQAFLPLPSENEAIAGIAEITEGTFWSKKNGLDAQ